MVVLEPFQQKNSDHSNTSLAMLHKLDGPKMRGVAKSVSCSGGGDGVARVLDSGRSVMSAASMPNRIGSANNRGHGSFNNSSGSKCTLDLASTVSGSTASTAEMTTTSEDGEPENHNHSGDFVSTASGLSKTPKAIKKVCTLSRSHHGVRRASCSAVPSTASKAAAWKSMSNLEFNPYEDDPFGDDHLHNSGQSFVGDDSNDEWWGIGDDADKLRNSPQSRKGGNNKDVPVLPVTKVATKVQNVPLRAVPGRTQSMIETRKGAAADLMQVNSSSSLDEGSFHLPTNSSFKNHRASGEDSFHITTAPRTFGGAHASFSHFNKSTNSFGGLNNGGSNSSLPTPITRRSSSEHGSKKAQQSPLTPTKSNESAGLNLTTPTSKGGSGGIGTGKPGSLAPLGSDSGGADTTPGGSNCKDGAEKSTTGSGKTIKKKRIKVRALDISDHAGSDSQEIQAALRAWQSEHPEHAGKATALLRRLSNDEGTATIVQRPSLHRANSSDDVVSPTKTPRSSLRSKLNRANSVDHMETVQEGATRSLRGSRRDSSENGKLEIQSLASLKPSGSDTASLHDSSSDVNGGSCTDTPVKRRSRSLSRRLSSVGHTSTSSGAGDASTVVSTDTRRDRARSKSRRRSSVTASSVASTAGAATRDRARSKSRRRSSVAAGTSVDPPDNEVAEETSLDSPVNEGQDSPKKVVRRSKSKGRVDARRGRSRSRARPSSSGSALSAATEADHKHHQQSAAAATQKLPQPIAATWKRSHSLSASPKKEKRRSRSCAAPGALERQSRRDSTASGHESRSRSKSKESKDKSSSPKQSSVASAGAAGSDSKHRKSRCKSIGPSCGGGRSSDETRSRRPSTATNVSSVTKPSEQSPEEGVLKRTTNTPLRMKLTSEPKAPVTPGSVSSSSTGSAAQRKRLYAKIPASSLASHGIALTQNSPIIGSPIFESKYATMDQYNSSSSHQGKGNKDILTKLENAGISTGQVRRMAEAGLHVAAS